jgi:hypothetical protein
MAVGLGPEPERAKYNGVIWNGGRQLHRPGRGADAARPRSVVLGPRNGRRRTNHRKGVPRKRLYPTLVLIRGCGLRHLTRFGPRRALELSWPSCGPHGRRRRTGQRAAANGDRASQTRRSATPHRDTLAASTVGAAMTLRGRRSSFATPEVLSATGGLVRAGKKLRELRIFAHRSRSGCLGLLSSRPASASDADHQECACDLSPEGCSP